VIRSKVVPPHKVRDKRAMVTGSRSGRASFYTQAKEVSTPEVSTIGKYKLLLAVLLQRTHEGGLVLWSLESSVSELG